MNRVAAIVLALTACSSESVDPAGSEDGDPTMGDVVATPEECGEFWSCRVDALTGLSYSGPECAAELQLDPISCGVTGEEYVGAATIRLATSMDGGARIVLDHEDGDRIVYEDGRCEDGTVRVGAGVPPAVGLAGRWRVEVLCTDDNVSSTVVGYAEITDGDLARQAEIVVCQPEIAPC